MPRNNTLPDLPCAPMARRGHGAGSVYRDGNRWIAAASLGRGEDGKLRRKRRHARTKTEAERLLREMLAELQQGGTLQADRRMTVGQWLDHWIATDLGVSQKTAKDYEAVVRLHLRPSLGGKRLVDLTAMHIEQLLRTKEADGYSPDSRRVMRSVLRRSLNDAVRQGLVQRNAAADSKAPRVPPSQRRALSDEQLVALFAVLERLPDPERGVFEMLRYTGARAGEVCGLQVRDVDLPGAVLHLRRDVARVQVDSSAEWGHKTELRVGELKTAMSRRSLPITAPMAKVLQRVIRSGASPEDWVFGTWRGQPVDPNKASKTFREVSERVLGSPWKLHELRHTAITRLVAAGGVETASKIAGHSSIRVTADVYHHPDLDQLRRAMDQLE